MNQNRRAAIKRKASNIHLPQVQSTLIRLTANTLAIKSTMTNNTQSIPTKPYQTTNPPISNPYTTPHTQISIQTTSLSTIRPIKSLQMAKEKVLSIVGIISRRMALAITLRINKSRRLYWMKSSWKGLRKTRNFLIWAIMFHRGTEIQKGQDNPWLIGPLQRSVSNKT